MRGGYYVFRGAVGIMYFRSWIPSKSADDNLYECVKFFGFVKYTNTIGSNTQIHFEIRPKYSLNLRENLKKFKNF